MTTDTISPASPSSTEHSHTAQRLQVVADAVNGQISGSKTKIYLEIKDNNNVWTKIENYQIKEGVQSFLLNPGAYRAKWYDGDSNDSIKVILS